MDLFDKIGIDWFSLLTYVVNLGILVTGLTYLLYKPIRKMIAKRKEMLDNVFVENEHLNEEAINMRRKYEKMLDNSRLEVARVAEETAQKSKQQAEVIIGEANARAAEIVMSAKSEMNAERTRLEGDFKDSVADAAIEVAAAILEREVSKVDNQKIISQSLEKWSN